MNQLEKDHSMIETRRLKNVVIFIQAILNFVLSRKIINTATILHRIMEMLQIKIFENMKN